MARRRSEFVTVNNPPEGGTGCWDITYNQWAPNALCAGAYSSAECQQYFRAFPGKKVVAVKAKMRNFMGEGLVNSVKANPVPTIAVGLGGLIALPWIAKKLKLEFFGKYNKAVFMVGGALIGIAVAAPLTHAFTGGSSPVAEAPADDVIPGS